MIPRISTRKKFIPEEKIEEDVEEEAYKEKVKEMRKIKRIGMLEKLTQLVMGGGP